MRLRLKRNNDLRRETYTVLRGGEELGAVWRSDLDGWRHYGASGFATRAAAVNDLTRAGKMEKKAR